MKCLSRRSRIICCDGLIDLNPDVCSEHGQLSDFRELVD